jgi:hypothetical protein
MAMDPATADSPPTDVPPAAPKAAASTRRSTRWLNVALVAAVGIAVAGVAFAVGRATAPSALDQLRSDAASGQGGPIVVGPGGQGFPGQGGQGGQGQGGQGQGGPFARFGGGGIAIEGTVESIDGDSMTIKTADGQTIEVSLDTDTSYHTATDASASSVTSGSTVVVRVQASGQPGSGGGLSLDADDVTVVP